MVAVEQKKILGIDPGTARMGYALLSSQPEVIDCGIIETFQRNTDSHRLAEIRRDLVALVEHYKPDLMSVEKLFFFRNITTVIPVAQARGVVMEVAGSYEIPVYEYTPLQVKQIVTGNGRAEKSLLAEAVEREFGLGSIKPDDAVDAVAIALSYLRSDHLMNSN